MGWFWPTYIIFQLKKYRGVMFNCNQGWYKVWRKTGLCFQKFTWGISQIFTRAFENLQIGTLMESFCLKSQFALEYQPHPLFLAKPPSKLTNCPSPPPLLYWFFVTPSLKVGSFSEPQKHYSFSSLIPSYLLKVTKFLGKSPLFEFLVTTEKYFFL